MKRLRLTLVLCVTPAIVAIGCDDGVNPPGPYVSLQELDQTQQPTTQPLGVLVDVVASGGNVVRLQALGGVFANGSTSTLCINFPIPAVNTTVVSVVPTQTEALVNAYLGNRATVDAGAGAADAGSPSQKGQSDAAIGATAGPGAGPPTAATTPVPFLDPGCVDTSFVAEDVSASAVVSIGRAPPAPIASAPDAGSLIESGAEVDAGEAADGGDLGDIESGSDGTPHDGTDGGTDAAIGDTADGGPDDGAADGGDAS